MVQERFRAERRHRLQSDQGLLEGTQQPGVYSSSCKCMAGVRVQPKKRDSKRFGAVTERMQNVSERCVLSLANYRQIVDSGRAKGCS